MIRVGLTAYLVLAVLAGPALCCCVRRQTAGPADPSGGPAAQHAGAKRSCCAHNIPPAGEPSCDTERPLRERNDSQCPACPCKQQGDSLALLAPSGDAGSDLVKRSQSLPSLMDGAILCGGEVSHPFGDHSSPGRDGHASRFLTHQDLLHTLQRLRC